MVVLTILLQLENAHALVDKLGMEERPTRSASADRQEFNRLMKKNNGVNAKMAECYVIKSANVQAVVSYAVINADVPLEASPTGMRRQRRAHLNRKQHPHPHPHLHRLNRSLNAPVEGK